MGVKKKWERRKRMRDAKPGCERTSLCTKIRLQEAAPSVGLVLGRGGKAEQPK